MKRHTSLVLVFALAFQTAFAQQPTTQPTPSPERTVETPQQPAPARVSPSPAPSAEATFGNQQDDDVVRITTNLVQIDAVVTDRDGRQVTDLRAEDFEILENDRPQAITNFSYVELAPQPSAAQPIASPMTNRAGTSAPGVPPARLRPEQVRRTIALVVDDLGLSFPSVHFVRQSLRRFVNEQMQPGDLVAIIRTSAGIGALQQFTADKRQLEASIDRVRWNMRGRGGIGTFAAIEGGPLSQAGNGIGRGGGGEDNSESIEERDRLEEFREEIFTVGTLGALNFVVRGLRELPGRKAVVLLSDGIPIFNRDGQSDRILESLRRLTDLANRASVIFYTIDARGLQVPGMLTAADNTSDMSPQQVDALLRGRSAAFFESQNGLNYLALQTGGLAVRNTNDISGGIRRVLTDQSGYYLIGYRPGEGSFNQAGGPNVRFNNLRVRVRRPGLRVRTRSGFYNVENEQVRPIRRTRTEQLAGAITSPFATGGVGVRLTSLFGNDAQAGSFMRSMLHIEARDFTFALQPDGWHQSVIDVLALTFGDNGRIVDELNRTETVRVRGEAYERIRRDGLVYFVNVPVRQPGAYQLRVAVRDTASERVGSASQFIEVPNLSRNRLALSGLVTVGRSARPASGADAGRQSGGQGENLINEENVQASPAVRRFRQGMTLDYGYGIYNARLDRASRRPQLTTQVRLFRDGQQVFAGRELPFDATGQTDLRRLTAGGGITLGRELVPGEYVLQIIVTDTLLRDTRRRTAATSIDFEIVR